jgi:hypothetical protein
MGRWLELFRTLKNIGIEGLTPGTPDDTYDACAPSPVSKVSELSTPTEKRLCGSLLQPERVSLFGGPVFDRSAQYGSVKGFLDCLLRFRDP